MPSAAPPRGLAPRRSAARSDPRGCARGWDALCHDQEVFPDTLGRRLVTQQHGVRMNKRYKGAPPKAGGSGGSSSSVRTDHSAVTAAAAAAADVLVAARNMMMSCHDSESYDFQ